MNSNERLDSLLPPDPGVGRVEPLPANLTAGTMPADLPRHLRDRIAEPVMQGQRSEQTAALVAAAVEWGLDDSQILAMALAHAPSREKYGKRTANEVARLVGKYRPHHQHIGQPCDRASCMHMPAWMGRSARHPSPNGTRKPRPKTRTPTVETLAKTIASYHHIEDSGYIWFALAVAVSGLAFDGEPLWGMLVGPSSSGKTETARALGAVAGHIDDLTASALMSWSKGKNPRQVGILNRIGDRGVVTIGDFSTVLATSNKGAKDQLFAMLRRIYDGHLTRDLGTAPEQLRWDGRLTILACCTPIIDEYTSHADSLGPRWLYYRIAPRSLEGMRAMTKAARIPAAEGRVKAADLAEQIVTAAVKRAETIELNDTVTDIISDLAIVACYGRASVPRSAFGRREITGEATREEPARLYKQLTLLVRALLALGSNARDALRLARRCALDSIPQTRRKALDLLVTELEMTVSEIAREIGCDRKVARFALEELAAAGVLSWPENYDEDDPEQSRWLVKTWKLDGLAAPLIKRILTTDPDRLIKGISAGQPWEQNDVTDESRREITHARDTENVRTSNFASQGSPAESDDVPPVTEEQLWSE
jgi:hypothetical protein